ncbi:MAG: anion transporter [Planctomycetes bacterium]|nr:anion transporter [Planctomycetota bacterium]
MPAIMNHAVAAVAIFTATYVLISIHKIDFLNLDRPSTAFGGAILMVVSGVLTLDEAYRAINHDTLALLLGMMVVIAYLRMARFFQFTSAWILNHAGNPRRMLVLLAFASGLLSALFVNDTICFLFTPILLSAVLHAELDPVPYLIALVTSSNIGSVAMLTGNPQNMLIGISSGIHFGKFFLVMLPLGGVCLALNSALLLRLFRGRLPERFSHATRQPPRMHVTVVLRMAGVLTLMLLGFLLPLERAIPGITTGQKLPLVASAGAVLAILVGRYRPRQAFLHVDWSLLLFFSGLFIVIAGVAKVGVLERMHEAVLPFFGEGAGTQTASFTLLSVAASQVVSNVPYVLVAREWVPSFARPELMWYVLAAASTFAGNLTVVGSVANIIVLEMSREVAPIGFLTYFRAGLPVTVVTTVVGVALLWGISAMGWIG